MKIVAGVLIGLLVLIGLGTIAVYIKNGKVPANLGVEKGQLAPMPSKPNAVSSQTDVEEKKVEPFPYKGSLALTKEAIKKAVEDFGGAELIKEEEHYLYYVFTTGKMKFHDDVEFYFDDEKQVVEFRSASRAGYSDMGLNRQRYEALMESYKK